MRKIAEYIAKAYNLEMNGDYCTEWVSPLELLTENRFDIIAKYIYIENKMSDCKHGKKLYLDHIRAMTKNSFIEAGNVRKNSAEAFCNAFDELILDIGTHGYREEYIPIPVDENMNILDGSHRTATCLYYNCPIKIVKLPVKLSTGYDYKYFRKNGLNEKYLDEMILRYIELSKDIYIANIWPVAEEGYKKVEKLIKKTGNIFYDKEVKLEMRGAVNYIRQVYQNDSWIGDVNNQFEGCYRKAVACFEDRNVIKIYVFKTSGKNVLPLKEAVRNLFDKGKNSIHINDTKEEAVTMARLLLNQNSIDFLNRGDVCKYPKSYKRFCAFSGEKKDGAVTGSMVMALYGIREANDLDFIDKQGTEGAHNYLERYYPDKVQELLSNPEYYFFSDNLKILTINCVRQFKKARNEKKDREDVELINAYLEGRKENKVAEWKREYILKKRLLMAKIQGSLLIIAHRTNTYDVLKKLYHFIRRKNR